MKKTSVILRKQRKRIVALLPEECGVIEEHCKAIVLVHNRSFLTSINPESVLNETVSMDSQDIRFSKIVYIIQDDFNFFPELKNEYTNEMKENRINKFKEKENNK